MTILGWVVWSGLVLLAATWTYGCRIYAHRPDGVNIVTLNQTLSFWTLAAMFYFFTWNKLHLIWAAPAAFAASYLLTYPAFIPFLSLLGWPARLFGHVISLRMTSARK